MRATTVELRKAFWGESWDSEASKVIISQLSTSKDLESPRETGSWAGLWGLSCNWGGWHHSLGLSLELYGKGENLLNILITVSCLVLSLVSSLTLLLPRLLSWWTVLELWAEINSFCGLLLSGCLITANRKSIYDIRYSCASLLSLSREDFHCSLSWKFKHGGYEIMCVGLSAHGT